MQPIRATYAHALETAVPEALSWSAIWEVARDVRSQILANGLERKMPQDLLVERASSLIVNEIPYEVHWDLEHALTDGSSRPAMGATEYDPAEPRSIMVSVNGRMLNGYDELLRSTSAHELGHVVFDAPSWIRQGLGQRMISLATGNRYGFRGQEAGDVSEQRANEFMGALLTPPAMLKVDFMRLAKKYRFVPSERPSAVLKGAQAYEGSHQKPDVYHETLCDLAERYGVTPGFIRIRLGRYDLLRLFRPF